MTESKQELTNIAKEWASNWLNDLIEHELEQGPLSRESAASYEDNLSDWLSEARERYALNDIRASRKAAQSLLESQTNETSIDFQYLCQEISRQTINVYESLHNKVSKGTPLPESLLKNTSTLIDTNSVSSINKTPLSQVFAEYSKDKIASGEWSRKRTEQGNQLSFRILVELIGDIPITEFDKEIARTLKDRIVRYPAQREKLANIKSLSINEILNGQCSYTEISRQTAQNHFVKATAFLNWATNNGFIDKNPLANMGIKITKSAKESRQPFSKPDLKAIFSSPVFSENKHKNDYYYWLPLIALHTGARIEEICQLHLTDIKEIGGILCFDISDKHPDQQLKNNSSRRSVPVHPKLVQLGLIEYINIRKTTGEHLLLPKLEKMSERYSHMPSKWFGRFKKKIGIEERTKTFHSFRHSVIDNLRATLTPDYAIKEIVGHSDDSTTHSVYGSRNPAPLAPTIQSMDWNDVLEKVEPFCAK